MNNRAVTIGIVLGVALVLLGAGVVWWTARSPAAHPGVAVKRIEVPLGHWQKQGFVEMVPPVRLPTDRDAKDQIRVWLKVGAGSIGTKVTTDGRTLLTWPVGTIADRVESMGDAVVDVRGTTLVSDGELFHVYLAEAEAPSPLIGWQWRRGDLDAENYVTTQLLARLERTRFQVRGEPRVTPKQHQRNLKLYELTNDCASCHVHERPQVLEGNDVHRATDAAGFFVPQSVLADVVPLERHRPWDVNVGDSLLTLSCADGAAPVLRERGLRRVYICNGPEVPVGRRDVARGVAMNDPQTLALCQSRRYLFERMDPTARAAFAAAFVACGIGPGA